MPRRLWTREDLIITFNLYLSIPFGQMHHRNVDVIRIAKLIDRTPSSIAMRLGNFASHDPFHQSRGVRGLTGGARQCQPIWDEYNANKEELIFETEQLIAKYENLTIEEKYEVYDDVHLIGKDKTRFIKTRVNQNVFRKIILNIYSSQCAVTGIDIPGLLFASHIIPWAENKDERLNPENGICLSSLYDTAFDRGLIGFRDDYSVVLSPRILKETNKPYFEKYFKSLRDLKLKMPERYRPKKEFLQYHMDVVFQG